MARGKRAAKDKESGDASPIASDAKSDNGTTKIDPTSLAKLVAAILSAIVTAISTVMAAVPPSDVTPSTTKYSFAINPYDTQSFSVYTKEGKHQWDQSNKPQEGRKPLPLTVANSEKILNIFKY